MIKSPNRQKGISQSLSKPKETVSRHCKSPVNSIATTEPNSHRVINHQKPMEHKHADSFLSNKTKYLRDNGLEGMEE